MYHKHTANNNQCDKTRMGKIGIINALRKMIILTKLERLKYISLTH